MNTKAGRLLESGLQLISQAGLYAPDSYHAKRLSGEFWAAYGDLDLERARLALNGLSLLVEAAKAVSQTEE